MNNILTLPEQELPFPKDPSCPEPEAPLPSPQSATIHDIVPLLGYTGLRLAEFDFPKDAPRGRPGPKRRTKLNQKDDFQEYKLHLFPGMARQGQE